MTVLVNKDLLLILRPNTPILQGALVCWTVPLPQEIDFDGAGRGGTRTRVLTGNGENRGGKLYEEEKEGGR